MMRQDLVFDRPASLQATAPPESRGVARDRVRLLVSEGGRHRHARFSDLPRVLARGDLLVVNDSATVPASLPATSRVGAFRLNLCTRFGARSWLAEPRWSHARPGPLPIAPGGGAEAAGLAVAFVRPYPGLPRLWFVRVEGDPELAMRARGEPIRYAYARGPFPLEAYQTMFARVPGSAEMPSAARPFTPRLVRALERAGVRVAALTLHAGVSSMEVEEEDVAAHPLPPEPYAVPDATAAAVEEARAAGRRVVAVGTTVARALESAWDGRRVRAGAGMTRLRIDPERGVRVADGLLTGLHDPVTSHLALLAAVGGLPHVMDAYAEAVRAGYLWHEFGDSHLLLPR